MRIVTASEMYAIDQYTIEQIGISEQSIMQHDNIQEAISNAVFVHGKAADLLIETGHSPLDVLATDVIEAIPETLFPLYKKISPVSFCRMVRDLYFLNFCL